MSDLVLITDLIAAKQREIVEFVATAGDVTNGQMTKLDRGHLALSLLGLIAKGRASPAPIVIDHDPSAPGKEIAPPKPKKAVAVTAKDPKQAKTTKPKAVRGGPKRFTDEMIAEALASTTSVDEAAQKLGCNAVTVYDYGKRLGLQETPEARAARMAGMRARIGKGGVRSEPKLVRPTHSDAEIAAAIAEGKTDKAAARILRCGTSIVSDYRKRNGLPRARNGGIPWNAENIEKLRCIATRSPRLPVSEIAAEFGISVSGIQTALSRFGITKKGLPQVGRAPADLSHLTNRNCMACETPFLSEGKHNRLCRRCKRSDEDVAA